MKILGRYNWKNQPERLVYTGIHRYNGDHRDWHQFELVGNPGQVWCEVLSPDLDSFEETAPATQENANG